MWDGAATAGLNQAACLGVLGDHRRAVVTYLGERESGWLGQIRDLPEEAVVATCRLCAALDDVPGDHGAG